MQGKKTTMQKMQCNKLQCKNKLQFLKNARETATKEARHINAKKCNGKTMQCKKQCTAKKNCKNWWWAPPPAPPLPKPSPRES